MSSMVGRSDVASVLDELPFLRLAFVLEVLEERAMPPLKGHLLHQAIEWWLAMLWCRRRAGNPRAERLDCADCPLDEPCRFRDLLHPVVDPTWAKKTRYLVGNNPSPAYALSDGHDRRARFYPGDIWRVELTLIGQAAVSSHANWVEAMIRAGRGGIGARERLRVRVGEVVVTTSAGPLSYDAWAGHLAEVPSPAQGRCWAEQWPTPTRALRLRFLSPIQCKMRGQDVLQPDFLPLMRAVVRRLRILSEVHGAGEWPQEEYGPLLDLAEIVSLDYHETTVITVPHDHRPIRGFVGEAWYSAADLRKLLPILWAGQWLHLSRGAVYGNGRYQILPAE